MFKTKSDRDITYFGRENTKDIRKVCPLFEKINTVDDLFELLLDAWCRETAYPSCQDEYCFEENPTSGQCAITAMLVYDIFGGTIHKIHFECGGTHYFNKINGKYIDLTSDQFFGFGYVIDYEQNEEVPVEYCCKSKNTVKRFILLSERLKNLMEYNYDRIESGFHEFEWGLGTIGDKLAIIDDKYEPVTDFIYKSLLYNPMNAETKDEFENWKRRFGYDCLAFQKSENNKMGVIDKDLKEIIPFIYDDIEIYQEPPSSLLTLFIAQKNSKYGLLDKNNKVLLDFIYDDISVYPKFYEVKIDDKSETIKRM